MDNIALIVMSAILCFIGFESLIHSYRLQYYTFLSFFVSSIWIVGLLGLAGIVSKTFISIVCLSLSAWTVPVFFDGSATKEDKQACWVWMIFFGGIGVVGLLV